MWATRVSIPLRHFNGVPNCEITHAIRIPDPFSLSSVVTLIAHRAALLQDIGRGRYTILLKRWKVVYRTRCFHLVCNGLLAFGLVILWTWPEGSRIFSDKLKSILLPPGPPLGPPNRSRNACWGTWPTPAAMGRAHASPSSRPLSSPWSVSHRASTKGFTRSLRTRPLPPSPHLPLTPVPNLSREAGSSVDPGRARPGHLSKPS
ncbi:hypothetical protein B0T18DRAFT_227455 [Schizothecium vesticola]|uniref:Uncharacterized protein n=1 Tax=Schizothecium vesticola TaxID=314040 RepID=A0AA40K097_9PEZI|nr:hypothetical protein B0T18DRAFT_227455 [Schizothecium vesticola]